VLPEQQRTQLKQAAQQMRQAYSNLNLPAASLKQIETTCRQSTSAMKQAMATYKCP